MTERIITGCLLLVGIIHLIPITGVLGADKLQALYGLSMTDNNLQILMRHRAVLFGILGAFIVYAAFVPAHQPMAFLAAFLSLTSFFWLAFSADSFSPAIRKIVIVDVIAILALGLAIALHYLKKPA